MTRVSAGPVVRDGDNHHAGQGAVLLDIGADTGALVVTCPARLLGLEVGIRPARGGQRAGSAGELGEPGATPPPDGGHPWRGRPPHVGVVNRPLPSGRAVPSAVYPGLEPGDYVIWVLPDGQARPVHVAAGVVTCVHWSDEDG